MDGSGNGKHYESGVQKGTTQAGSNIAYTVNQLFGRKGRRNEATGRLATAELRSWKILAHEEFESLWRLSRKQNRRANAYKWLAAQMGLPQDRTHIGMFNVEQCKEVVRLCEELRAKLKTA